MHTKVFAKLKTFLLNRNEQIYMCFCLLYRYPSAYVHITVQVRFLSIYSYMDTLNVEHWTIVWKVVAAHWICVLGPCSLYMVNLKPAHVTFLFSNFQIQLFYIPLPAGLLMHPWTNVARWHILPHAAPHGQPRLVVWLTWWECLLPSLLTLVRLHLVTPSL